MARTSRNGAPAASVDALDNLNLDDMFADEGDALFDDLDIDLGNMDDIAGGNVEDRSPAAAPPLHQEEPSPANDEEESSSTRKRRTTKRKIKSPMFFEDEDDDYLEEPSRKKKKRASSKVPTTKKKSKTPNAMAAAAAATVASELASVSSEPSSAPAPRAKGKAGRKTSVAMPPPVIRGSSGVAAAGQFGGRAKRGASFTVNKSSKAKTAPRSTEGPPKAQRSASVTMPPSLAQIQATHPGLNQSPFCGLLPSNTLFYPFMPALPSEPSFKHRKIFPVIDRLHTAFMSQIGSGTTPAGTPSASTAEPIVQLMLEAFKDEKGVGEGAEREAGIGGAVGALRRTIANSEKNRLAGDLLAVCALLKRQHDFLKQNAVNMQQWCKSHFSEADYASVYLPPKPKIKKKADASVMPLPSVLRSLKASEIKVRLVCNGIKDPRAVLVAVLPPLDGSEKQAKSKKKKKKLSAASLQSAKSLSPVRPTIDAAAPKPAVQYTNMRPNKRRKSVADLVARSARDLEATFLQRFDDQMQTIERQQEEMRKLVDEDKVQVIHTTGMWRWLERSGHFAPITESDIRWRLDGIISPDVKKDGTQSPALLSRELDPKPVIRSEGTLFDRLQSLLIAEVDDDDGVPGVESDDDDDSALLYEEGASDSQLLDLSALTAEERCLMHVRSVGLLHDSSLLRTVVSDVAANPKNEKPLHNPEAVVNGEVNDGVAKLPSDQQDDEIGGVIQGMIADLSTLNDFNKRRASALESAARSYYLTESDPRRKGEEAILIARCLQVMKKAKEGKGKNNGKAKTAKSDEYALPW